MAKDKKNKAIKIGHFKLIYFGGEDPFISISQNNRPNKSLSITDPKEALVLSTWLKIFGNNLKKESQERSK